MNSNFPKNKKTSRQMLDIRPVKKKNDILAKKKSENIGEISQNKRADFDFEEKSRYADKFKKFDEEMFLEREMLKKKKRGKQQNFNKNKYGNKKRIFSFKDIFFILIKFSVAIIFFFFLFNFIITGFRIKNNGIISGQVAFSNLLSAKDSIKNKDFEKAHSQFRDAYSRLDEISKNFDDMGIFLVDSTKYIPYASKISSGKNLILVGRDLSEIGILISESFQNIEVLRLEENKKNEPISYLRLFQNNEKNIKRVAELLENIQDNLEDVNIEDVPENERNRVIEIKKRLPEANQILEEFLKRDKLLVDVLGGNGPRKYLFLFQNNQEMRATGGFIGSYGLLDIFDGRVRKFFIDGIFNPDGQLREKIVPPVPIQKISAAWSLHDSNWFPDFPKSAEKAAWFYEKTGGPTVDGVIAITPTVMQKLLEITGPIEMAEYDLIVDKNNFIEKIQQEVEVDYDKELNQPKKILADLAPKVLEKILKMNALSDISKIANVFLESLNEKQVLIYSKNKEVEKFISENGWSGEILKTEKDYLSVINTNINGFKTDGVVSEEIFHEAEIQTDGTIIDTLTIIRKHNGGDAAYDWWNKVNANYMRVYLPLGSKLISVEGQTREFNTPPLNYSALKFKRDAELQAEENSIEIDEASGTRIYDDGDKTVFGNWVYVSPKETVKIKYVYLLPFKIDFNESNKTESYSLLVQKQSGSVGSKFISEINYPNSYDVLWRYPEEKDLEFGNLSFENDSMRMETNLKTNKFLGLAFTK